MSLLSALSLREWDGTMGMRRSECQVHAGGPDSRIADRVRGRHGLHEHGRQEQRGYL
ncbi:hypothetical protein L227DRAFT_578929 [Lentinus tigrinus ALCF2SS1-6]|uniref:Uncharacterized protein n=1 Tax=Lentinus tigrinus ALCF2SS1-6 TaxID=1328759 RepID=A0A5C2RYQ3_9APHY|nr:hypothetical protein L227DRAFT_578929 [Lentinus tigrinus ALCF2SS1-6]